jgi:hypothetical protein
MYLAEVCEESFKAILDRESCFDICRVASLVVCDQTLFQLGCELYTELAWNIEVALNALGGIVYIRISSRDEELLELLKQLSNILMLLSV